MLLQLHMKRQKLGYTPIGKYRQHESTIYKASTNFAHGFYYFSFHAGEETKGLAAFRGPFYSLLMVIFLANLAVNDLREQ